MPIIIFIDILGLVIPIWSQDVYIPFQGMYEYDYGCMHPQYQWDAYLLDEDTLTLRVRVSIHYTSMLLLESNIEKGVGGPRVMDII